MNIESISAENLFELKIIELSSQKQKQIDSSHGGLRRQTPRPVEGFFMIGMVWSGGISAARCSARQSKYIQ